MSRQHARSHLRQRAPRLRLLPSGRLQPNQGLVDRSRRRRLQPRVPDLSQHLEVLARTSPSTRRLFPADVGGTQRDSLPRLPHQPSAPDVHRRLYGGHSQLHRLSRPRVRAEQRRAQQPREPRARALPVRQRQVLRMPRERPAIADVSGRWWRLLIGATAIWCGLGVIPHARAAGRRRPRAGATSAAPAKPAKTAKVAASSSAGSVQFVTEKRAYLDRGAKEGLAPKQSLQLFPGGRAVGACAIETLADHQATCVGGRPRAGDSFRLPQRPGAKKRERTAALPPVIDEETLRSRAVVVSEAPYEKVDFNGVHALAAHTHGEVRAGFMVWHTSPDPNGDYSVEELDGTVQVYDLGATGIDFNAAFTAIRWGARAAIGRFQPTQQSQFYLWEAEFSKRGADAKTVFAVGRIWPWHAPGLTLLDGVQVGRHNEGETAEGGVYAGLVPLASTVAPTFTAWASGVYGALVENGSKKSAFQLAREEARVGVWGAPGTGLVADAEVLAQAWLGAWNVGGGGRALLATAVNANPVIDRAYLDLGARATTTFGIGLHLRYFGAALPALAILQGVTPSPTGSFNALADAHWELSRRLGVSGFGGFNQDRDTGRNLGYAAAELRLPRLLGGAGGVSVGGEVEGGWLRGGLLYGQVGARIWERVQILARVSASATEYEIPTPSPNVDELGGYLQFDGALCSWLRVRASSLIRVPFLIQGATPWDQTFGLVVGLSLVGSF